MNFDDLIYKIKSTNPIESIIGEYIELKKSGSNYKGLCPFHNEKTPSFFVSPDKGFYHCFGCKNSGDVIKFLQEIEHIDFMEAIEILAKKSGINIDDYRDKNYRKSDSSEIFEVNKIAMDYFINRLKFNKQIVEYLNNRGLNSENIKEFKLGYSDKNYTLLKFIKEKKYNLNSFIKAGLIGKGQNDYYDRFYGRIMFPIINHLGHVIGFGGRIYNKEGAKYINSSENQVFKKGNFLYGLNLSKNEIYEKKYLILVEGYMDFISLYKSGIKNVVAQLGTACTENQAKLIKRMCEKVIIMYDSDKAGKEATFRSIPILLKEGLIADIFVYKKECKDPDELSENIEGFSNKYVEDNTKDFIDYTLAYYEKENEDDLLKQKHIIKYVNNAINGIDDSVLQNLYTKLASDKLNIDIRNFETKKRIVKKRLKILNKEEYKKDIFYETLSIMLSKDEYAKRICEEIDENEFLDTIAKGLYIEICNMLYEFKEINLDKLLIGDKIKDLREYFNERIIFYLNSEKNDKKIDVIIRMIKMENIKRKIEDNNMKIKMTNDDEEKERLQEMNIILKQKLKKGDS